MKDHQVMDVKNRADVIPIVTLVVLPKVWHFIVCGPSLGAARQNVLV